jgi:hypothetical protein
LWLLCLYEILPKVIICTSFLFRFGVPLFRDFELLIGLADFRFLLLTMSNSDKYAYKGCFCFFLMDSVFFFLLGLRTEARRD